MMKREPAVRHGPGMTHVTASMWVRGHLVTTEVVVADDIAKRLQMVAYQGDHHVELRLIDGDTLYAVTRQQL